MDYSTSALIDHIIKNLVTKNRIRNADESKMMRDVLVDLVKLAKEELRVDQLRLAELDMRQIEKAMQK